MTEEKAGPIEGAQDEAPLDANTEEKSVPEVAGEEAETEAAAPAVKSYVEYADAQHFEIRTITPHDWQKAGVEGGKLLHWHKGNGHRVPLGDVMAFLTEDQFNSMILADPRFRVIEA